MLRHQRPGLWLSLALAADLLAFTTGAAATPGTFLWVGLSLWLAHRTWQGGATALACYRVLQWSGVCLFSMALVVAHWDNSVTTEVTIVTVLLYAVSVWCLMAPALSNHVDAQSGESAELESAQLGGE